MGMLNSAVRLPSPNETEAILLQIWQSVLQREDITLADEFIDVGGDSLSAMMCISRIRETFTFELSMDDFFMEHATIKRFASALDLAKLADG